MSFHRPHWHLAVTLGLMCLPAVLLGRDAAWPSYFDLGPHLVEEFQGTYKFNSSPPSRQGGLRV